jgi:hypothetical protein
MIRETGNTAYLFTADTLTDTVSHDRFSIGRFIPLSDTASAIHSTTLSHKTFLSDYFTFAARTAGELRQAEIINTDFSFILLSFSLMLLTLLAVFGRKSVSSGLASLSFRHHPESLPPGTSAVFSWQPLFRNVFSALNTGLFTAVSFFLTGVVTYTNHYAFIKMTAIITGAFIAGLMLRHLACIISAEISGMKTLFREYMNIIYNAWFANALILFILNAIILFAPVSNTIPFVISGVIIAAILLIIRILRLLVIFLNQHISIFYFILYLCALEVLPALMILKILGVF